MFEIKIPSVGESIVVVQVLAWHVEDGAYVEKGATILELETEKAAVSIEAEVSGKISILAREGEEVKVGAVVGRIETGPAKEVPASKNKGPDGSEGKKPAASGSWASGVASPAAAKILKEAGVDSTLLSSGSGKDGRITKGDVIGYLEKKPPERASDRLVFHDPGKSGRQSLDEIQAFSARIHFREIEGENTNAYPSRLGERRERMSMLRQSLSRKLVAVKNQTAMLTTFNEVDMSFVQKIRKDNAEAFRQKYNIKLGLMSFFTKAAAFSLLELPQVNAFVDGTDIIFHDYIHIGIAVHTDRGLMVPVLKDADKKELWEIERGVAELAEKARTGKIKIEEMEGGTFTISNGGVFGSLLSTPILNPPQSAILGMHTIKERPIALGGRVEVRPMMYLALSYDHRVVDGRESVGFLMKIKEFLENPGLLFKGV